MIHPAWYSNPHNTNTLFSIISIFSGCSQPNNWVWLKIKHVSYHYVVRSKMLLGWTKMSVCLSFCDGCRVIRKVTNFLVKVNNKEEKMTSSSCLWVSQSRKLLSQKFSLCEQIMKFQHLFKDIETLRQPRLVQFLE